MARIDKDTQRDYFYEGAYPTDEQMDNVVDSQLGVLDDVGDLPEPNAQNLGDEYKIGNVFYKCKYENGDYFWDSTGAAEPVTRYSDLDGKPKIGGVTIAGNISDVDTIGGLSKNLEVYGSIGAVNLSENDNVYINHDGNWMKSTVGALRKPLSAVVTILMTDWVSDQSLGFVATVNAGYANTGRTIIAAPAPSSIPAYFNTPFYLASSDNGELVFACSSQPSTTLYVNIIYW